MYNVSLIGGSAGGSAAVQSATSLNAAPTTSASAAPATVTLTGAAGQRVTIRQIVLFVSVAGTATLTVADGATTILNFGTLSLTLAATIIPLTVTGSVGNSMTVNIGAVTAATSTTSVIADRQ